MNGGQDLGGVHGLGPIDPEIDEPVFHAEWEKRAFALTLAMGFYGQWNIDQGRHARESMHPAKYMTSSYYQIWTEGLIKLMLDTGFVVPGEVHLGRQEVTPRDLHRDPVAADEVAAILARGWPASRDLDTKPKFKTGSKVRAIRMNPGGHTRLPRYLRGCEGEIVAWHKGHVFPDTNAHGKGENPQHLYTVRFAARELWGADAPANDCMHADLWESYLVPA